MSSLRPVPAPAGLGPAGKRLWRGVAAQAARDVSALDGRELLWLGLAAAEADALALIEAALAGQPRMVLGAQGQLAAHPLVAEARRSRAAIAAWLRLLDLLGPVEGREGRGSRTTSVSARAAANRRHFGAATGLGGA